MLFHHQKQNWLKLVSMSGSLLVPVCIMESILLLFSTNKKSRRSGDCSRPDTRPTPLWPRDGLQGKCFSCLAQGLMSIHSACV